MLSRLYCDNYKCLVNFEFRPAATQLLMGCNGAGKSTVFEVLELLRDFSSGAEMRDEDGTERLAGRTRTRWQDVQEQRFELEVTSEAGAYAYELVVDESNHPVRPKVRRERVSLDGQPLFLFEDGVLHLHNDRFEDRVQFPLSPYRSGLAIVESRKDNAKLSWFRNWLARVQVAQVDPKRMAKVGVRAEKDAVRPSHDLDNFAEWYRHLRLEQGSATDDLRVALREVIDGFESLDLKEAGLNTRVLHVAMRSRSNGVARPTLYTFGELSDGQRALIALYTLLHCGLGDSATLCIDEPDNFIALAEIQPWLLSLTDRARLTGSQVLVASHHPELLNLLARDGVILDRDDSGPTRVRPFVPPADTTLTPAEIVALGWENA